MPYETVYEVGLLDDLHNYFPDVLYRPQRFLGVQDLLQYVQQMTRHNFNLFERGRRAYERDTGLRSGVAQRVPQNTHVQYSADLQPFISLLIPRVSRSTGTTTGFQDVIVNASQDLIEEASTQITLEEDANDNCPICQDNMRQGELIRKLNVCNHKFHKSCIDNWLLNDSVLCPTCRHDIRQPARIPSPLLGPSPAPTASTAPTGMTGLVTPPRNPLQAPLQVPGAPGAQARSTLRQRNLDLTSDLLNMVLGTLEL